MTSYLGNLVVLLVLEVQVVQEVLDLHCKDLKMQSHIWS